MKADRARVAGSTTSSLGSTSHLRPPLLPRRANGTVARAVRRGRRGPPPLHRCRERGARPGPAARLPAARRHVGAPGRGTCPRDRRVVAPDLLGLRRVGRARQHVPLHHARLRRPARRAARPPRPRPGGRSAACRWAATWPSPSSASTPSGSRPSILADTRAAADTTVVFERRTDQQDQVARIGTTALIEILLAGLLSDDTTAPPASTWSSRSGGSWPTRPPGYIGALEAMKHRADATDELAADLGAHARDRGRGRRPVAAGRGPRACTSASRIGAGGPAPGRPPVEPGSGRGVQRRGRRLPGPPMRRGRPRGCWWWRSSPLRPARSGARNRAPTASSWCGEPERRRTFSPVPSLGERIVEHLTTKGASLDDGELAEALGVHRPVIAETCRQLEAQGLVVRNMAGGTRPVAARAAPAAPRAVATAPAAPAAPAADRRRRHRRAVRPSPPMPAGCSRPGGAPASSAGQAVLPGGVGRPLRAGLRATAGSWATWCGWPTGATVRGQVGGHRRGRAHRRPRDQRRPPLPRLRRGVGRPQPLAGPLPPAARRRRDVVPRRRPAGTPGLTGSSAPATKRATPSRRERR